MLSVPSINDPEQEERRREMVRQQLAARGIQDPAVLDAMGRIPRELFVSPEWVESAYEDRALPAGLDQTISQPYIVALMTENLRLSPEHRVLEIGTGTGYQTAVLARLAREVYTVERHESLAVQARERLERLSFTNVQFLIGDGSLGWQQFAPYDRIMVTAAAPQIVPELVDQLAIGGRLIIPTGENENQNLSAIDRLSGRTVETPLLPVRFVKLIGKAAFGE
jgi:protein-L-isoaspartate(D-aspartate) O-methyltransferase